MYTEHIKPIPFIPKVSFLEQPEKENYRVSRVSRLIQVTLKMAVGMLYVCAAVSVC